MPTRQKGLFKYIPASIRPGKDFHVSYYVINPNSGELVRKKIRLNRIKKKKDRDLFARNLANTINVKLAEGWNPFLENEAPKSLYKLVDVLETYKSVRFREFENASIRTYKSLIKLLTGYITDVLKEPNMFVYQFNQTKAADIMLWIFTEKNISGKTYNNYLIIFKAIFNWMKEFNYVNINPFEKIKRKQEKEKFRKPIDDETKEKIRCYLEKYNRNYLAICLFCYHCFIRPKEIVELKINDINLIEKTVRVRAEIAKNDTESFRTIPSYMTNYLLKLNFNVPDHYYLFSDNKSDNPYSFNPGPKKMDSRKIAKYWEKLRKILELPKEIQFYSLKDSGIIQMFEDGVSLPKIQAQADHSSDKITRIYYNHKKKTASNEILEKVSEF